VPVRWRRSIGREGDQEPDAGLAGTVWKLVLVRQLYRSKGSTILNIPSASPCNGRLNVTEKYRRPWCDF
jgi:hypothetical protein